MKAFRPGQSFRIFVNSAVLGTLIDPSSSVVTVSAPDGSTVLSLTPTPVGGTAIAPSGFIYNWYADGVLPTSLTSTGTVWHFTWVSSGLLPSQNASSKGEFFVDPV